MKHSAAIRLKRALDVFGALMILVALFPLFVSVAFLIYVSMGRPIFFRQERLGFGGRTFWIFKFRTMTDAREESGTLLPDGQRLTRIGSFLRKVTLDEIPELINVLRGDMSLVGPRPLLVEYRDLYTAEQMRRHEMPPGMAGPVLAGGRNALSWEEKFAFDVWYVDNWSLWLDFKILALTAWKVLKREGISAEGHATMPKFEGTKGVHEEEGRA